MADRKLGHFLVCLAVFKYLVSALESSESSVSKLKKLRNIRTKSSNRDRVCGSHAAPNLPAG